MLEKCLTTYSLVMFPISLYCSNKKPIKDKKLTNRFPERGNLLFLHQENRVPAKMNNVPKSVLKYPGLFLYLYDLKMWSTSFQQTLEIQFRYSVIESIR